MAAYVVGLHGEGVASDVNGLIVTAGIGDDVEAVVGLNPIVFG